MAKAAPTPAGYHSIDLDDLLGISGGGDRDIWAKSLTAAKRKAGKVTPQAVNLEAAITGIQITDTIAGSSTIVLTIKDDDWELVDSGFFDCNKDGKLDTMEVNYPRGSALWWRCTQVSISANHGGADITMTFMERAVCYLLSHVGPWKDSRAKSTRAEFLKKLTKKVKKTDLDFVCKQLTKIQPKEKPEEKSAAEKKHDKDQGISTSEIIRFKDYHGDEVQLKPGEIRNANKVMAEATKHTQLNRPLLALLEACIVEGPCFANPGTPGPDSGTSVGILQLTDDHGSVSDRREIALCVKKFLKDPGYTSKGGAITLAKAHKDWNPGTIAQTVQGSGYGDRYEKSRDGAQQVLDAWGGLGDLAGDEYVKQYNFHVGSKEKPHETYWDAMTRLADEVKWALFCDGDTIYYDAETTLIKQKVAGVFDRNHEAVISFSANWDVRKIATEATLELVCEPFEFRAGETIKLNGFGPASSGSAADPPRPGVWLIQDIDRDRFALTSTFTLKQPVDPKPEPRSGTATREDSTDTGVGGYSNAREHIVAVAVASIANKIPSGYTKPGEGRVDPAQMKKVHPPAGYHSDCSQWVHACYVTAGYPSPGTWTGEMVAQVKAHKNGAKRTSTPKPGDIMLQGGGDAHHCELYVGRGDWKGNTIGHGTAEINRADTKDFPGHYFITFDFLDGRTSDTRSSSGPGAVGQPGHGG